MYAIIRDSGQQIKVEKGQQLNVDYREASAGESLSFDEVLAVSTEEGLQLGRPLLEGFSVKAEVLGVAQGPKLIVQKIRRRTHNSRTKTGHRQLYTRVRIDKIAGPNLPEASAPSEQDQKTEDTAKKAEAKATDSAGNSGSSKE
jgi:large subunit ribosomal protein L21